MEWVVRERYDGRWVSTYFSDSAKAHKLYRKILKAGGVSICLRAAL